MLKLKYFYEIMYVEGVPTSGLYGKILQNT
jgi:hypothetical protein